MSATLTKLVQAVLADHSCWYALHDQLLEEGYEALAWFTKATFACELLPHFVERMAKGEETWASVENTRRRIHRSVIAGALEPSFSCKREDYRLRCLEETNK